MFCIPIVASDADDAVRKIREARDRADVLELRLDMMNSFDLTRMVEASDLPVLATYRTRKEGGQGRDDPETVGKIILDAIESGAQLVDMELGLPRAGQKRVREARGGAKVIVSTHFTGGTPSRPELVRVLEESASLKGDVVKIVTTANEWEDILRVLELIPLAHRQGLKIIAFCMGPIGRISRVLAHLMGGYLTFTSLETGQESAAGQIPIEEMKALIKSFG